MWGACVGIYELLNCKMHGETLKFETLIMSLLAANGGTVTAISVEIFRLTFVTNSGFFWKCCAWQKLLCGYDRN